jgi:hypothetical protein
MPYASIVRHVLLAIAITACGDNGGAGPGGVSREAEVLLVPAVTNPDVDLLFVIDNSPATLQWQDALHAAFPGFVAAFGTLPNLHIGAITTDLGTRATDGTHAATIPGSVGGCANDGDNGNLQTYGTTLVTGTFISDVAAADGSRQINYTGALSNAFTAITSAGSAGCGFEQPLGAVVRALDNNPANAGFLRPSANLAIVLLVDEDDCSLAHSTLLDPNDASLGPFQSFRCTHYGITCDQDINAVGPKTGCRSNEQSDYLTPVATQLAFLTGVKADPRTVTAMAIVGDATPFAVEERATGSDAVLALGHSCEMTDPMNRIDVADPGVRLGTFATQLRRGLARSICSDYSATMTDLTAQVASMTGSTCLVAPIVTPPQCTVADETLDGATINIPPCPATGDCYTLATDATCPGEQLKLVLTRTHAPPANMMTSVRCLVP